MYIDEEEVPVEYGGKKTVVFNVEEYLESDAYYTGGINGAKPPLYT